MSTPMTYGRFSIATALFAACVATIPAVRAADANPVERTYSVVHLNVQEARLLIDEKLGDAKQGCGPTVVDYGSLRLVCPPEVHERIAEILKQYDAPRRSYGFQIILLEGSLEPGASPALAPGPRKALDDVRQMLPFKGYRLLETGLFRTAERGFVTIGSGFQAEMTTKSGREPSSPVFVGEFRVAHVASGNRHVFIDTSFSIKVNETVVVGTSKLNGGDKALVVLVTALD